MADQLGADAPAREEAPDLDPEVDGAIDLFAPRPAESTATDAAPSGTGAGLPASSPSSRPAFDHQPATETGAGTEPPSTEGGMAGFKARLGVRSRGQLRARKVQRIVRRVDPWSVLKVSLLFYACVWLMVMVALVLIWGTAMSSGTVGSLESFIAEFLAFEEFKFNGDQLFQIFALGGLIGVFVATATTAVLAVLFNLIADLTGGIRFTVVEEESARRIVNPR